MKKITILSGVALFSCGCFAAPSSPLFRPAQDGDTAKMLSALELGADPNERWGFMLGQTPLHIAVAYSREAAVKLLIERGADVNARLTRGYRSTPLHYAACTGQAGIVKMLLAAGADPEPGMGACHNGNKEAPPLKLAEIHEHSMAAGLLRDAINSRLGITAGSMKNSGEYGPLAAALLKDHAGQAHTIAVTGFSYADGRASADGNIVAERLTTEFINQKKLKVVERKAIEKVLLELKLQNAGSIDPDSAKKLGRMLGADLLVVGGMVELPGGVLELNIRLASVESGEAVGAISGRVRKDWVTE